MALKSQGIFLPKNQLKQHFESAVRAFKYVAKQARGQVLTQQFNDKAFVMQGFANIVDHMTKEVCLDALENMRHAYYEAADNTADQKAALKLLRRAVFIQTLIQKERRHG
ncbi:hypothetical protein [Wohlfahrtiimonas larvae]|uniref:Four helix bundle protein n=1 Tax=Wohlfahrtiimonas larvae TaxID=1157986 RepID=A0ABP9MSJ0_9GAMM|nr:hypothetical protein [Wohlfahrtiimonas larvae]